MKKIALIFLFLISICIAEVVTIIIDEPGSEIGIYKVNTIDLMVKEKGIVTFTTVNGKKYTFINCKMKIINYKL